MKYLLDSDVFLSAIYRKHVGHPNSRAWLDSAKPSAWGIAIETCLAATRLLMNPSVMGSGALTAVEALNAVETVLSGPHPGRLLGPRKPDRKILEKAKGHRQVMDFWLVQMARGAKAKLATRDEGILRHWPEYAERVA